MKNQPKEIIHRLAENKDMWDVLAWRNEPNTRKFMGNSDIISKETHEKWFKESLADPNRIIYIICLKEKPEVKVGQIRFDKISGDVCNYAQIDITLNPKFKHNGYGSIIIEKMCDFYFAYNPDVKVLSASIKKNNPSSIKVFARCGFDVYSEFNGIIKMRRFKE